MDVTDLLGTQPSDMMMALYLRPIHPEFFRIFASRTFRATDYEAELWVTGLSHVLTVRQIDSSGVAERCLTEVIGSSSMVLPARGRVESLPLQGEDEVRRRLRNRFRYQISFQSEQIKEGDVFAATYDALRNQGFKEGLSCEYRVDGMERKLWPLALLVPMHTRGGFLLHAFHVFPDYLTILKTQTLIEMPER